MTRPSRRATKPRLSNWRSSSASSYSPRCIVRSTLAIPTAADRFVRPTRIRNVPATSDPTIPRVCSIADSSSCTGPASARTPSASRRASPKTTLEWPSENQKPADSDRVPSPTSFRVVLSMTAIWSASKAWRTPSRYAVTPRPTPNTPAEPSVMCCGATPRTSTPQPMTCNSRTKPVTAAIEVQSARSNRVADRAVRAVACDAPMVIARA